MPVLPNNSSILWLLLDIEGTTSSADFVYKTLFPFASARAESYLRKHFAEDEIGATVESLRAEHQVEAAQNPQLSKWMNATADEEIASATGYVRHLIALDRKVTPLKTLQGKIWEEGFFNGELKGHVYEDVPRALVRWREERKKIAIFSSGSVLAQRLLFGHSTSGDLTKYIEAYFDTTTGLKREAASYRAIGKALGAETKTVLFVSDVTAELDAAREAGMQTALMVRPEAERPKNPQHGCIANFEEL